MRRICRAILFLTISAVPIGGMAQAIHPLSGTRLEVVVSGEVTRVPDTAMITAGVVTRSATATQAITENAQQMQRVISALREAGVGERDIQTSFFNLNPDMGRRNEGPVAAGYSASNQLTVRFRNVAQAGKIIDALVSAGANQVNGPTLSVEQPSGALDEARVQAIRNATSRAQLYASATGKRVGRVLAISESGSGFAPPHLNQVAYGESRGGSETTIVPGKQTLSVTLALTFELE